MTITLQVAQRFDSYNVGDLITLPDLAAQALLKAFPGRYQFSSSAPGPSPGSPIVVPARPNAVIAVVGAPDPVLGASYGYALDLTSTPATLYHWSGTAWTVVLQAGGGSIAPVLQVLTLATLVGTAVQPFTALISGATIGSTLAATAADGTALTITSGVLSGTFAAAGQKQISIVETLAGATGSPKTTTFTLVIAAAGPVLQVLGLASLAASAGMPFSAALSGQTAGSTIAAASSDGTILTVANGRVSGNFAATGQPTITLTETLAGATGSPKSTQLAVTVSAQSSSGQTLDFTNPANSSLLGAI